VLFREEHAFSVIGDLKWERREWIAVVFVSGSGCFELRLSVYRMKAWKVEFGRELKQWCIPGSMDCLYELYSVGWTPVGLQGDMKTEVLPVSEAHHILDLQQICTCIYMYSFCHL
jgi:hypothetical protein